MKINSINININKNSGLQFGQYSLRQENELIKSLHLNDYQEAAIMAKCVEVDRNIEEYKNSLSNRAITYHRMVPNLVTKREKITALDLAAADYEKAREVSRSIKDKEYFLLSQSQMVKQRLSLEA